MTDRQERIVGWKQSALADAVGLQVGAGGIGSEIASGLVRKGIGELHLCDFDIVTPSNLNRQFFGKRNLYKNKARELCRNLSRQGWMGTRLVAHPCAFQDVALDDIEPNFVVCGVDNQLPATRLAVCRWAHRRGIPAVFIAVTPDADAGYVFVQEPESACWACVFKPEFARKDKDNGQDDKCPGVSASLDIIRALAGRALFATDSVLMGRLRDWNYWYLSLSRSDVCASTMVARRDGCSACGNTKEVSERHVTIAGMMDVASDARSKA